MPALGVRRDRMQAAAKQGFSTATDLADYLVRKGVAFRDAHEIVGRAVRAGVEQQRDLAEMSLQELQSFSAEIGEDVFSVLTLEGSVAARNHTGGTDPGQVRSSIEQARARLDARRDG
jgi:argininosuccinate lyase